jgi:hypothetical protein
MEGERKHVTALFADIKGSTELMRDLDPEDARVIIDPALKVMIDAAHRYDGYVVQSTGDGIFALFGAAVAREDHPQRALHAAIAMRDELRRRGEELKTQGKSAVEVRIGINTGEVVLRMIRTPRLDMWPISRRGCRPSHRRAASSSVRTRGGWSRVTSKSATWAAPKSKALASQSNVYEVVGIGALRGHFELAARRGLTKFVGREREVAEMKRALELACSGQGQIVAAVGDAGAGKSRLIYEFKRQVPDDYRVLEAYSVSHGKAAAYLPVMELLYHYFGIEDADDKVERRAKVETGINALDAALNDTLPLFYTLMGLHAGLDPIAQMGPQVKRRRTLDAISGLDAPRPELAVRAGATRKIPKFLNNDVGTCGAMTTAR